MQELPQPPRGNGFTAVELLVASFVIAVLLVIFVPAVQSATQSARATECRHRMRNLVLACHRMQSTGQRFPSGFSVFAENGYEFSMHTRLLPYICRTW
ncbi:MAG: type II secretion system protein [Planctomycetota bacterium]